MMMMVMMMSHLHARDQHHFEHVLGAGGRVSHGNVEGPVDAEGHLSQVALRLLPIAVVWHIDVREHTVEVKTCLLACKETINLFILHSFHSTLIHISPFFNYFHFSSFQFGTIRVRFTKIITDTHTLTH